ncbi:hypothetical protein OHR86_28745 [Streptomyces sp. NBC_00441]|uniref:hypothetical protein n=1 Tax=Streptomyces sp. NBC_00441 TaxID=2975742 RepID=UPI002E2A133A|nr:hypothetical protein [Streptomyces sp. NBC_00441]
MTGRARSGPRRTPGSRPAPARQPHHVTGRHRTVRARFLLRETPGVTVGPAGDGVLDTDGRDPVADAALLAAQRALAEAGRCYLGGRLELRAPGRTRAARDRRAVRRAVGRAAALAVAATLRGDDTGVDVRVTRR